MYAFKTLLILGETGTGKSSLCNRLAGLDASSDRFPVSSDTNSCTQTTVFQNIPFGGDEGKYVTAIDTMGFDDPKKDIDFDVIAKFIASLKRRCYAVNVFGITINGMEPRLDGPLVEMLTLCEEMFGDIFWKQCCLIFTKTPMGAAIKKKREKNRKMSDQAFANKFVNDLVIRLPKATNKVPYVFLDSWFEEFEEETDNDEKECYMKSFDTIRNLLNNSGKLLTSKINENIKPERKELKRKIVEEAKKIDNLWL